MLKHEKWQTQPCSSVYNAFKGDALGSLFSLCFPLHSKLRSCFNSMINSASYILLFNIVIFIKQQKNFIRAYNFRELLAFCLKLARFSAGSIILFPQMSIHTPFRSCSRFRLIPGRRNCNMSTTKLTHLYHLVCFKMVCCPCLEISSPSRHFVSLHKLLSSGVGGC